MSHLVLAIRQHCLLDPSRSRPRHTAVSHGRAIYKSPLANRHLQHENAKLFLWSQAAFASGASWASMWSGKLSTPKAVFSAHAAVQLWRRQGPPATSYAYFEPSFLVTAPGPLFAKVQFPMKVGSSKKQILWHKSVSAKPVRGEARRGMLPVAPNVSDERYPKWDESHSKSLKSHVSMMRLPVLVPAIDYESPIWPGQFPYMFSTRLYIKHRTYPYLVKIFLAHGSEGLSTIRARWRSECDSLPNHGSCF